MTDQEKELLKGFNAGYIIDQQKPELAKKLVEAAENIDEPYIEGFVAGSKESGKERAITKSKVIDRLKGFAKNTPKVSKDKDKGFDIDR